MRKNKILSVFITLVMIITAISMFGGVEAYAASISKPAVSLSNASATSVKISWKKVSKAKKYTVYQSTKKSKGYKAIKTTKSTSFTASKLTAGKTYYFKVKAVSGKKNATSSVKSIKVKPVKVKSVKIAKNCSSLKVNWAKSSGATGYEVYSSASKSGKYSKISTVTSNSYNNTGLKLKTTKYYKVRAYKTVKGKKVYGDYSSVVSGSTYSAHEPASSWIITKKATCSSKGTRTNTCANCNAKIVEDIPKSDDHNYVASTVSASSTNCPYTKYTCSRCGDVYKNEAKKHKYVKTVTDPTCTSEGYTLYECTRSNCGYDYIGDRTKKTPHKYVDVEAKATCTDPATVIKQCSVCLQYDPKSEFIPENGNPLGHKFDNVFKFTKEGYRIPVCIVCEEQILDQIDYTCYIDLSNYTISVPDSAEFKSSSSAAEGTRDKLDLTPTDKTKEYEIIGSASNLTIDVNASKNVEIKLNGVTIENADKDCFDLKNKSTEVKKDSEGNEVPVVPTVSISAKDETTNLLKSTATGNAIESSCNLELKGHGKLDMDTVSTTINCNGKIEIKNISLTITSKNRGIDTNNRIRDAQGKYTDFSNVTIKPNANIVVNSTDDGIRCKNMDIIELGEGDVNTILNITSTAGDGIQLEGNRGITVNSGTLLINAGKYAFNCKPTLVKFNNGVSSADCKGTKGFAKEK